MAYMIMDAIIENPESTKILNFDSIRKASLSFCQKNSFLASERGIHK